MSSKPAVILVPGSFAPGSLYDNILEPIRSQGISFSVVDLVTVGKKEGPLPTMYDDAAHIAAAVSKLVEEGQEVVLIGHSYAGLPITQSTKGLTKKEREAEGKKGGIVRLGYMTSVLAEVGMNAQQALGEATSGMLGVAEDGWMYQADLKLSASLVANNLDPEEGVAIIARFQNHSSVSFTNELTHSGYNDVPSSWLFCEEDLCVTPELQQNGIDRIEKSSGRKVDVTRLKSDHVPTASHAEESIKWIVGLAEKGGS